MYLTGLAKEEKGNANLKKISIWIGREYYHVALGKWYREFNISHGVFNCSLLNLDIILLGLIVTGYH